jgi:hypothetical protein
VLSTEREGSHVSDFKDVHRFIGKDI